jgi:hypothetical protein
MIAASAPLRSMEIAVPSILLGAIVGRTGLLPLPAVAQDTSSALRIEVRYEAPVGHRQPTIAATEQSASGKARRSATDVDADEAVRRSERELRNKLIICRGC